MTLPSGEKPEIVVFSNDQQRALVQASYRHRYGVFIRLDLCTGLRMGELLALKWEDIDFSTAQLHVRRTINRLAKYEAHDRREQNRDCIWYTQNQELPPHRFR